MVMGILMDLGVKQRIIDMMLLSLECQFSVNALFDEAESRGKLDFITQFLEKAVADGSVDSCVHTSLAKCYVHTDNVNATTFLTSNMVGNVANKWNLWIIHY